MFALVVLYGLTASVPYPDAIDHLKSGTVVPRIGLLLDRSGSMNDFPGVATTCHHYADNHNSGNTTLSKMKMLQATLTGCEEASDGVLDLWEAKAKFSILEFSSIVSLAAPFGATHDQLEASVLSMTPGGSTYMAAALGDAGRYFHNYFDNTNATSCTPFYLVILSDGNPNGGATTLDYECTQPIERLDVQPSQPWFASDYLYRNEDVLCSLTGSQNVNTYAIGFGAPGTFSPSNLQNIADRGGGTYYFATDAQQLGSVFNTIINEITAASAVFFTPPAVQTEAFFSSNYAYSAAFRPRKSGPWVGTIKKFCVVPPTTSLGKYDTSVDSCIFTSPDGTQLLTNPEAEDLWTGVRDLSADVGGAGAVLFDQLGTTPGGSPEAPYWDHRNILSWRNDGQGYVPIHPTKWSSADAWTNGCDTHRLINFLHGYTWDADCETGAPVAARTWVLGDPINSQPVLLRYGECEDENGTSVAGRCFVVVAMNDGMLHFFDSATGRETSALIPHELWATGIVPNSTLSQIQQQPGTNYSHRYYVDGGARLFHEDQNRDGIIDGTESAYLFFGLGRGGRAYYAIPVSQLEDGVLTSDTNPVYPLTPGDGSAFTELRDTWAAPWAGLVKDAGAVKSAVAFPSGHIGEYDFVESDGADPEAPPPPTEEPVDLNNRKPVNCKGKQGFAEFNGLPDSWCDQYYLPTCNGGASKCYDGSTVPIDRTDVLSYNNGLWEPAAFRVYLDAFDLNKADYFNVKDGKGNLVKSYSGKGTLKNKWTDWVYGDQISLQFVTDGIETNNKGYRILKIEWVPSSTFIGTGDDVEEGPPPPPGHVPTVWLVDIENFNGKEPKAFVNTPSKGAVILQVAKTCTGGDGECLDQTKAPDLANMVCPISAEISVRTDAGYATAMYWGDECGQIWKAWTEDDGVSWDARRIINLNAGATVVDKDHRKIFRRLELVHSVCPGKSVVGVYFGTGNVQRPGATDELQDAAVTNGRDIIGVVWDHSGLPDNLTEANLADATDDPISPKEAFAQGKAGWFISLAKNERMLRDPLVYDSVAYFKTWEPTQQAEECSSASGIDRIYGVDNCSAEAVTDADGDGNAVLSEREVWAGQTEIGGGLFLFTPKDSPVLVSHADLSKESEANLNVMKRPRLKLLLWRRIDR